MSMLYGESYIFRSRDYHPPSVLNHQILVNRWRGTDIVNSLPFSQIGSLVFALSHGIVFSHETFVAFFGLCLAHLGSPFASPSSPWHTCLDGYSRLGNFIPSGGEKLLRYSFARRPRIGQSTVRTIALYPAAGSYGQSYSEARWDFSFSGVLRTFSPPQHTQIYR